MAIHAVLTCDVTFVTVVVSPAVVAVPSTECKFYDLIPPLWAAHLPHRHFEFIQIE